MTKPLAKSAVSQKRVLDAAARIFRDYGYAGATMRVIAEEAGLKAGSLYYHYQSKDALIGAVLDVGMNAAIEAMNAALATLPPEATGRQRLEAAFRTHVATIIANGDYSLATSRVYGQVPAAIRAQHEKLRDHYGLIWRNILATAQRHGEFRGDVNLTLARLLILGALNWTAEWFKPGNRSIDDVARGFAAIVMDGIAVPAGTAS
ncbi:MAG: TetR/AcrR family transcriptional regulator [Alphaproteobacteria bacterium]|nr:TetR/AcrR family transcriptional regulator [Alphaproteobacteria bacterium]